MSEPYGYRFVADSGLITGGEDHSPPLGAWSRRRRCRLAVSPVGSERRGADGGAQLPAGNVRAHTGRGGVSVPVADQTKNRAETLRVADPGQRTFAGLANAPLDAPSARNGGDALADGEPNPGDQTQFVHSRVPGRAGQYLSLNLRHAARLTCADRHGGYHVALSPPRRSYHQ